MTRLLKTAQTAALCLTVSAIAFSATAEGTLNLLTWEGYADPSFVEPFEEATGCSVTAIYVGSNDDFAPRLLAGRGIAASWVLTVTSSSAM